MENSDIEKRKETREYAESLFKLFIEDTNQNQEDKYQIVFFESLIKLCKLELKKLGQEETKTPQPIIPLTDAECVEFQRNYIPFGKYQGETISQIISQDPKYLHWVAFGSGSNFTRKLHKYLANENTAREMEGILND